MSDYARCDPAMRLLLVSVAGLTLLGLVAVAGLVYLAVDDKPMSASLSAVATAAVVALTSMLSDLVRRLPMPPRNNGVILLPQKEEEIRRG